MSGEHFICPPCGVISVDERVERRERVALIAASASVIHEVHCRRIDYRRRRRSGRRRSWRMRSRLLSSIVAIIRRVIIVGIERLLFGADHLLLLLLPLQLMILLLLARYRLIRVMMDLLRVERWSGRGRQG